MKVALIHDWLTGMRGGEKVLEVVCSLYPDADIQLLPGGQPHYRFVIGIQ